MSFCYLVLSDYLCSCVRNYQIKHSLNTYIVAVRYTVLICPDSRQCGASSIYGSLDECEDNCWNESPRRVDWDSLVVGVGGCSLADLDGTADIPACGEVCDHQYLGTAFCDLLFLRRVGRFQQASFAPPPHFRSFAPVLFGSFEPNHSDGL